MKILYCVYDMGVGGGVERVTTTKANYLKAQGHDVCILTTWPMSSSPMYGLDPDISVDWIGEGVGYHLDFQVSSLLRRSYNTLIRMYRHYKLMKAYLNKHKFDIVITTHPYEMGFLPFIKDGSKKITEIHTSQQKYVMERRGRNDWGTKLLIRSFIARDAILYRFFDAVGCLTEEDKIDRGSPSNMYVIPNPLSFETDKPSNCAELIVLAVGRHTEQKDFISMVCIWDRVVKDFPEWKLRIVGGGHLKNTLKQKIQQLDLEQSVILEPETDDPRPYYASASIYLMTSNFEGFGLVLTEAQNYGLPIISYACPCGPRDIVQEGTGYLIEPGNQENFAKKLKLLMGDAGLRRSMGAKARTASGRYSVEVVMSKWVDLFKQLIQKRKQTV